MISQRYAQILLIMLCLVVCSTIGENICTLQGFTIKKSNVEHFESLFDNKTVTSALFDWGYDVIKRASKEIRKFEDLIDNFNKKSDELLLSVNNEAAVKLRESNMLLRTPHSLEETKKKCKPTERDILLRVGNGFMEALSNSKIYLSKDGDDLWDLVGEEDGIKVWRCNAILSMDKSSHKWPCVKATTIIDAPAKELMNLLMDSTQSKRTNRYSAGRDDVLVCSDRTKIVWNRTRIPFSIRPYDFCNIIHCVEVRPNSNRYMIITKSVNYESVPINNEYTRAETYLGVNFIKPLKSDHQKTEITTINHVRYPGIPSFLASRNFYSGTVSYLKHLNSVAKELKASQS